MLVNVVVLAIKARKMFIDQTKHHNKKASMMYLGVMEFTIRHWTVGVLVLLNNVTIFFKPGLMGLMFFSSLQEFYV